MTAEKKNDVNLFQLHLNQFYSRGTHIHLLHYHTRSVPKCLFIFDLTDHSQNLTVLRSTAHILIYTHVHTLY